jgi:acetolactate synthase I/II/III large subunit
VSELTSNTVASERAVADVVVSALRAAGVDRVFGHPGGETLRLMEALEAGGIEYVLTRHEAAAGMMAAVYGKLKGTVGVALATLGPGAANLMLPVSNSLLDREPLLAISAQIGEDWPPEHTHQRLELEDVFAPVTKYVARLDASNAGIAVAEAIQEATSAPEGSAFVTLSSPKAAAAAAAEAGTPARSRSPRAQTDAAEAVSALHARLASASRPVLIVGLGANPDDSDALTRWIDAWGLPTFVTPKVKGIVDERNPNFVGVASGMAAEHVVQEILRDADLILGFGFDPVEADGPWHAELPSLHLLEAPHVGGFVPPDSLIVGYRSFLEAAVAAPPPALGWLAGEAVELRARILALLERNGPAPENPGGLWPADLLAAARQAIPETAIVATDVGAHKALFGQYWPTYRPRTFWMSNGLSGMGYGLPAAIGAKLAEPDRAVVAVVGDGGFAMSAAELETAARAGAPIVVLVLVDGALTLIRLAQARREFKNVGTEFSKLDAVAVAKAWGAEGVRVTTAEELGAALERHSSPERPVVIEVPVEAEDYNQVLFPSKDGS